MGFATPEDLAGRLVRTFTESETAQANVLLALATSAVAAAADKTDAWASTLDPVPGELKAVTVEVAARVMNNPQGVRSQQEQLGSYQHSESFADVTAALALTMPEQLRVRRAVYGTNSGSARAENLADHVFRDELDDGRIIITDFDEAS